jgi:glycosyltransferase involved in cell wall biosynthesis
MRFSVDAHALGRNLTGNEVYVRNLLSNFAVLDKESEFVTYVSEPGASVMVPDGFATRYVSPNPFRRLGLDISMRMRQDRPDLLHVQYTAPLICRTPIVATVHDISFLDRPEYFQPARAWQLRMTVERTVRLAAKVLTPSEFSAQCIQRAYGLDPDKIVVVPNGVSPLFRPMAREVARARIRLRFGIDRPYLLMVGDLQPRKNQIGLIRAFESLLHAHPDLPYDLVLTGQDSWYAPRVREAAARSVVSNRIHFTGFVNDAELGVLYGGCQMFVFPSFYEGFGLPIVEAMACGRAVACSSITATVEVADGAAITFDPASPVNMMRAMRDVLLDSDLRHRMEKKSLHRASSFQWRDAARKTLEVYYEVAERGQRSKSGRFKTRETRP